MRVAKVAVALVVLVTLTAAKQAPPPVQAPAPGPAVQPGEQSKVLSLARVGYRIPVGTKIGHVSCQVSILGVNLYMTQAMPQVDPTGFRGPFAAEAAAAGYATEGGGNTSLFADENHDTPGHLVGGAITGLNLEVCQFAGQSAILGASGSGRITVEWEIYDPLERKVIYRTTTNGQGRGTGGGGNSEVPYLRILIGAFQDAAHNLMYDSGFHAVATAGGDSQAAAGGGNQSATPETSQPFAMPQTGGGDQATTLTIPRLPLSTQPFTKQVEALRQQVVTVYTGLGSGSGFYISDSLLLTNQHVVGTGKEVRIKFHSGREIRGEVLATNSRRDVAVIRTDAIEAKGLPLHVEDPEVGSQVFVVGSPFGKEFESTVTSEIVSAVRTLRFGRFIQSDIMVNHGNSGGPMFDDKGNVVGITDIGIEPEGVPAGLNFFIPIGEALQTLNVTQTDGGR